MQAPGSQGFGPHWMTRQRLGDPGEIFTFYSYKGGTGRSMGMVNCAGLIAQQLPAGAKPLLLIDFDLEAPGLHRYLAPHLPNYASDRQAGVLELFEAFDAEVARRLGGSDQQRLDDETAAALVADFDLSAYTIALQPAAQPADAAAAVNQQLIVAGRFDRDYDARLQRFDWPGLYARAPAIFRALSARLSAEYSLVFVDSRTGLSDTTGICTMLLPDVLVVVFTPNSQSLTGIEHLVRSAVDYRAKAADLRALRVYPLASRVDNQVEHFRQVWRMGAPGHPLFGDVPGYQPLFTTLFSATLAAQVPADALAPLLGEYFDQVQVPHAADYAFGERLCYTQQSSSDSLSIRGAYELFLPWLVTGAQPWERPAERQNDWRAALWLRDAGVADGPASPQDWPSWFDRLARVAATADLRDLPLAALGAERRFDIALSQSLALAHVGDFGPARAMLDLAAAAYTDDAAASLAPRAPAALLELLHGEPPPPEAQADVATWLEALDRLMGRWQPLQRERRLWLQALLPLATEWGMPELRLRVAIECEGEDSDAAVAARLAAGQARGRAGDIAGAIALLADLAASTLPHIAGQAATARKLVKTLQHRAEDSPTRPLPSIEDSDCAAWISCAEADNAAWAGWVTDFGEELERGLRVRLRGVKLPPVLVTESAAAPAEGSGPAPLRQAARAFALVLVLGDAGAASVDCQRHAESFLQTYGQAGLRRLHVLALTRTASLQLRSWPVWHGLDAQDLPTTLEFFNAGTPDQPTEVFTARGVLSTDFVERFMPVRDALAHHIRASMAAAPPAATGEAALPSTRADAATPAAGTVYAGDVVVPDATASDRIRQSLQAAVAGAQLSWTLKDALQSLTQQVAEVSTMLPPADALQLAQDLKTLATEAASPNPRRAWIELSGSGLVEATRATPNRTAAVATAVGSVLDHFKKA